MLKILERAIETFKARSAVYGKGHYDHGRVMAALFPSGLTLRSPGDFTRFATLNMMVAKLCRYTNNWDKGGHADSVHDLGVYSFLMEEIDEELSIVPVCARCKSPEHHVSDCPEGGIAE